MFNRTVVVAALLSLSLACSGASASSVEGTVAASSFATTPASLTATDETGATTTVELGVGGAFLAKLQSAHTYRLAINTAAGTVPLLFPRANGQLDATFFIGSADAVISLGEIRALDSMPENGLAVSTDALTVASGDAGIDDTGITTCAVMHEHPSDGGGCSGGKGHTRHRGAERRGGRADAGAGRPAQGDSSKPFCFPQRNPPATVDCSTPQID